MIFYAFLGSKNPDYFIIVEFILSFVVMYFIPELANSIGRFMIIFNIFVVAYSNIKRESPFNYKDLIVLLSYVSAIYYFDQYTGDYNITWNYLGPFTLTLLPRRWYIWLLKKQNQQEPESEPEPEPYQKPQTKQEQDTQQHKPTQPL